MGGLKEAVHWIESIHAQKSILVEIKILILKSKSLESVYLPLLPTPSHRLRPLVDIVGHFTFPNPVLV